MCARCAWLHSGATRIHNTGYGGPGKTARSFLACSRAAPAVSFTTDKRLKSGKSYFARLPVFRFNSANSGDIFPNSISTALKKFDVDYADKIKLVQILSPRSFKESSEYYAAKLDATGNFGYAILTGLMSTIGDHPEEAGMILSMGRAGRQSRLKELGNDNKLGAADRGWIKQEMNSIEHGNRTNIRNPPGTELARERGREAAKGYDYRNSNLQDRDLHKTQHKYDDFGRANKERPLDK